MTKFRVYIKTVDKLNESYIITAYDLKSAKKQAKNLAKILRATVIDIKELTKN